MERSLNESNKNYSFLEVFRFPFRWLPKHFAMGGSSLGSIKLCVAGLNTASLVAICFESRYFSSLAQTLLSISAFSLLWNL